MISNLISLFSNLHIPCLIITASLILPEGYRTYMSAGAVVWARSDEFLVVGTVCLFLIPFAIIGFGTYYSSGEGMIFVLILFG